MKYYSIAVLILLIHCGSMLGFSQVQRSIRSQDFKNFTFPLTSDLIDPADIKKTVTLENGEFPFIHGENGQMGFILEKVQYADVTGDDVPEALIALSIVTGGSAVPGLIYVYTLRNNRPFMLWSRSTGDRANGGLRSMHGDGGRLAVELNSPVDSNGDCCPTRYTRTMYEWRKGRFKVRSRKNLAIVVTSSNN